MNYPEEVKINGVVYEKRKQDEKKTSNTSWKLPLHLLALGVDPLTLESTRNHTKEIDIVKEFELIQNKKSRLSANNRKSVIGRFNGMYNIKEKKNNVSS